jgi:hypothetical protein
METENFLQGEFSRICHAIDMEIGEPAACRYLINWWDETPRNLARAQLLPEIDRELDRRIAVKAGMS